MGEEKEGGGRGEKKRGGGGGNVEVREMRPYEKIVDDTHAHFGNCRYPSSTCYWFCIIMRPFL